VLAECTMRLRQPNRYAAPSGPNAHELYRGGAGASE